MQKRPKVFGCGLNKTGTTTLRHCLKRLGYRCVSCRPDLLKSYKRGVLDPIWEVADANDAFEDWPWPLMYRELHARYGTDARFVLTTRASPPVWLSSLMQHSLRTSPEQHCRFDAYGFNYPHGFESEHLAIYEQHNSSVRDYFAEYPGMLLEMCWENGDGWEKLASFLGCAVPDAPLPHAKRAEVEDRTANPVFRAANLANIERQLAEIALREDSAVDTTEQVVSPPHQDPQTRCMVPPLRRPERP